MPSLSAEKVCLVVEDNELTRQALGALLRQAGYQVLVAADGREALEHLRGSARPTLLITDLRMPVMDGWALLRHLKSRPELADIPTIVISAEAEAWRDVLDLGGATFLPKPLDVEDLLQVVGRLESEVVDL